MIKIITNRCLIRPFKSKDIDSFMLYRNDEEWMKYQGFKGLSKEAYESALLKDGSLNEGLQLSITNRYTDELIGDVYLLKENDDFWMGYTISPRVARQGYAYEVSEGVLKWIKSQHPTSIYAGVHPDNLASIQLLKKLGFNYFKLDEHGDEIYTMDN